MDSSRRHLTSGLCTGIPFVAHKRLNLSTPPPAFRLRNAVILGELDRIYNRPRPHPAVVPTEDFLNSRPLVWFDDEAKSIRAQTQALLRRVHAPTPRSSRHLLLSGAIPYHELPLPERITSDPYIIRMLEPYHTPVSKDIVNISHYYEPSRTTIGRGHLACVTFAGGRGYPRRKHLYSDENRDIRDEIKFRSYYDRNRMAAKEREAANILPTGFASRLLMVVPKEEPQHRPIKPYRHAISTPSMSKQRAEEKKAKELEDLEARIQKRRKEKDQDAPHDIKEGQEMKTIEDRKLEEERLAEQARIAKARQLEEERQAEEMRLQEKARKEEEAKRVEEAKKAEEEKRKAEEELRKAEEEMKKAEEEARIKMEEQARRAEEERRLEEIRLAEEERLAEEARLEEEARLTEEARLAEEAKLVEEARLIEEARLAEEATLAEEARLAEEAILAEEARLAEGSTLAEVKTEDEVKPNEDGMLEEEAQQVEEKLEEAMKPEKLSEGGKEVSEGDPEVGEGKEEEEEEVANAVSEEGDISPEPFIEEPQSPGAEDAVAEVIEGADATSEELDDE